MKYVELDGEFLSVYLKNGMSLEKTISRHFLHRLDELYFLVRSYEIINGTYTTKEELFATHA